MEKVGFSSRAYRNGQCDKRTIDSCCWNLGPCRSAQSLSLFSSPSLIFFSISPSLLGFSPSVFFLRVRSHWSSGGGRSSSVVLGLSQGERKNQWHRGQPRNGAVHVFLFRISSVALRCSKLCSKLCVRSVCSQRDAASHMTYKWKFS